MNLGKRLILITLIIGLVASCKKMVVDTTADEGASAVAAISGPSLASFTPAGLPKRVAFGTEGDVNQSASFIPETEYLYEYLAGDIFSAGWANWNVPAGEFARIFLAKCDEMGKVPVFTYYNIVPAKLRYQDPAFVNLNDAEVMNKYFDDWKLLLQICASYGKPVIIHYEPDLFGYMEMYKNDQTKNTIKVSDSKQADVLNFSNDAKGLAQAIVSMRNQYAPNALLGWHASTWATGSEVTNNGSNPELLAVETANYYKSLQANFDLVFSEFSDRDAGYKKVVDGKTNASWLTLATSANGNLSTFDRFQHFLKKLNDQTGKKIILWQIPIGNTITKTCNNTPGHYQDNTAEYFLNPVVQNADNSKLAQYSQAGVIAFLFGRGTSDCTNFMDSKGDGITGANETADDDGGFLRNSIKAYYKNGPVTVQ